MVAPSLATADTPDSGAPANRPAPPVSDSPQGRSMQPEDAAPSAPDAALEPVMPVSLQEAQELPPVTLMSSTADTIVPWSVHASSPSLPQKLFCPLSNDCSSEPKTVA